MRSFSNSGLAMTVVLAQSWKTIKKIWILKILIFADYFSCNKFAPVRRPRRRWWNHWSEEWGRRRVCPLKIYENLENSSKRIKTRRIYRRKSSRVNEELSLFKIHVHEISRQWNSIWNFFLVPAARRHVRVRFKMRFSKTRTRFPHEEEKKLSRFFTIDSNIDEKKMSPVKVEISSEESSVFPYKTIKITHSTW